MFPENPTRPPTIRYLPTGKVHFALNASGGPGDGSLHGFYTYCGRMITIGNQPNVWDEQPTAGVTCTICTRSEDLGRTERERTYYRNLAGELLAACEAAVSAYEDHDWSDYGVSDALYDAFERARAAIAKAQGSR